MGVCHAVRYTSNMQRMKMAWKRLPNNPRRILTFILGMLLVITAPLFGAIPGPGGMVLFLLGIAILATEFTWAERVRDMVLGALKHSGQYVRDHPRFSTFLIFVAIMAASASAYVFYTQIL